MVKRNKTVREGIINPALKAERKKVDAGRRAFFSSRAFKERNTYICTKLLRPITRAHSIATREHCHILDHHLDPKTLAYGWKRSDAYVSGHKLYAFTSHYSRVVSV